MRILHLAALAKQGIGFVEEQDRATALGSVEDAAQVLLGLADVLAHYRAQVDAVKIEPQGGRQHLRRHGLAGAALTGEERTDSQTANHLLRQSPGAIDLVTIAYVRRNLAQDSLLRFVQDQVVPVGAWFESLGQIVETGARVNAATVPQSLGELGWRCRS